VTLDWSRAYIVGVLNVTPDSFSDGGLYQEVDAAVARGLELAADGADIVDVGGESTRPQGARPVDAAEEIERVAPVIRELAGRGLTVSVDTTKAAVARAAVDAGAELVNDISGGLFDPAIAEVTADAGAAYVVGHVRGRTLAEVHRAERAPPTFDEVARELERRLEAMPAGLEGKLVVDPGLGFGKRTAQNLELSRRAGELAAQLGCAVMVGPSRKRFLGELTGAPAAERDPATVGASLAAVAGGAHLVRVHAVKLLRPALLVYEAIRGGGS
jgi:dihydropteroate synthase